jgi:hypothetical protein
MADKTGQGEALPEVDKPADQRFSSFDLPWAGGQISGLDEEPVNAAAEVAQVSLITRSQLADG